MTTMRGELQSQMEQFKAHGQVVLPKPTGSGPKGKPTQKEAMAHRRQLKGVEDEKQLGEWVEQFLPNVEKEEARVARARKKVLDTMRILQAAELRTTRTRRPARKVDYTYDSIEEDEELFPRRGGRRGAGSATYEPPRKPVIPGERRSGRIQARVDVEEEDEGTVSAAPSRDMSPAPSSPRPAEVFPMGAKKTKGYVYIEEPGSAPSKENGMANGGSRGRGTENEPMMVDDE